jgi:uncharacterized coiled-coil protein SlyX
MAVRNMEARVAALGEMIAAQNQLVPDLDQRLAEAEQKRDAMAKEMHIAKIEKLAEAHENDKQPPPASDEPQDEPADDRDKFVRFDRSTGSQSQKTAQRPMGGDARQTKRAQSSECRSNTWMQWPRSSEPGAA